jgi:hypothetical protein
LRFDLGIQSLLQKATVGSMSAYVPLASATHQT